MREHPIPQDITNYRFHIIGSMTLKQFAEIFLGVIVALIFYSTNLPDVIKWIFIVLSFGLGVMAAFLPIEERPLDHWIITFFRVMYRPTKYFWTREPHIPEPFTYEPRTNAEPYEPELDLSPARRQRIKEYLTSVNTPSEYQTDLTSWETERMEQIASIFSSSTTPAPAKTKRLKPASKPTLGVRVRKLRTSADSDLNIQKPNDETTIYQQQLNNSDTPAEQMPVVDISKINTGIDQYYPEPLVSQQNQPTTSQVVSVPQNTPVAANQTNQGQAPDEITDTAHNDNNLPKPDYTYVQNQQNAASNIDNVRSAAFNQDLPFPDPPNEPNKIVGMVLSPNNDLITNAIVEVQTEGGQIVRAVKTNALGQFFITTPLNNGTFVVKVDKNNYQFEPQKITLTGELLAPLEIRSI